MIFITGSDGYLGKKLSNYLEKKKIYHTSLSRNKKKNTMYSNSMLLDIRNFKKFYYNFNNDDVLIHLAWSKLENYFSTYHTKKILPDHIRFLNYLIRKKKLKNLICIGTCLEYGMKNGICKENMSCKPITHYGKSKLLLLKSLRNIQKSLFFNLTWIRLFYIYSNEPKKGTLFYNIEQKIKKKQNNFFLEKPFEKRDFINDKKIIKFIYKIALFRKNFGIINLGSGQSKYIKDKVQSYLKQNKKKLNVIFNSKKNAPFKGEYNFEPKNFFADISKLKKIIYDKKIS